MPRKLTQDFCLESQTKDKYTRLKPLSRDEQIFEDLEDLFLKGWKHPNKPRPRVHAIFKVLSPEKSLSTFVSYRIRIETLSFNGSKKQAAKGEQILFHGTKRRCMIGQDSDSVCPCALPDCSVCRIIRGSFDIDLCGSRHKFRRFGNGIYTTACSSKADDYSSNGGDADSSSLKVILANRVVVGKPHKRLQNATNLTEPPPGFHSVVGLPGMDLNYEETVVYHNDAIRPGYLIVYGEPSQVPSKRPSLLTRLFTTPMTG